LAEERHLNCVEQPDDEQNDPQRRGGATGPRVSLATAWLPDDRYPPWLVRRERSTELRDGLPR
jgi:hypothetical protein